MSHYARSQQAEQRDAAPRAREASNRACPSHFRLYTQVTNLRVQTRSGPIHLVNSKEFKISLLRSLFRPLLSLSSGDKLHCDYPVPTSPSTPVLLECEVPQLLNGASRSRRSTLGCASEDSGGTGFKVGQQQPWMVYSVARVLTRANLLRVCARHGCACPDGLCW